MTNAVSLASASPDVCARIISTLSSQNVVFFTGAGMSAECGIGTFRGAGGLWSSITGTAMLLYGGTPFGWFLTPSLIWPIFVDRFLLDILRAKPHAGHITIARRQLLDPTVSVVTMNVDRLHHRALLLAATTLARDHPELLRTNTPSADVSCTAGDETTSPEDVLVKNAVAAASARIFEVHGAVAAFRCSSSRCARPISCPQPPSDAGELEARPPAEGPAAQGSVAESVPANVWGEYQARLRQLRCPACGSAPRPDCTLFCESLPQAQFHGASRSVNKASAVVCIGTSSVVYPAASLPENALRAGKPVFDVNVTSDTPLAKAGARALVGRAGVELVQLLEAAEALQADRRRTT
eukprot:TRINITY_DN22254_c0_g1_i1.p1 TRINITY_DN22254_c0_g1~~TRINITY_DN22254_c0_g1_i1.p1  ORF type:complete len:388 (-),score=13.96 TRINITY_DN22254_c0_g1_i1:97-1155(-)